jgi:hypothetical protein
VGTQSSCHESFLETGRETPTKKGAGLETRRLPSDAFDGTGTSPPALMNCFTPTEFNLLYRLFTRNTAPIAGKIHRRQPDGEEHLRSL